MTKENCLKKCVSGEILPYPKGTLAAEIILLLVLTSVEAIRNFFGKTFAHARDTHRLVYIVLLRAVEYLFVWCSGYHICLTHRRSPVQFRPETTEFILLFYFAM